jgi:L,D-transpeptidase catalytic domain
MRVGARWLCSAMFLVMLAPPAQATLSWPRAGVLDLARRAYECGRAASLFDRPILTIIDYSLPSTEPRLWVVDLASRRVLFNELVAHGRNSGGNAALKFSNEPGSRQSSLGLFRTEGVYEGQHGYSLRLAGLEPGVNDRAYERAIVIHGAAYVSHRVAFARGRLGQSWGCPALEPGASRRVIDRSKDGTALFA